MQGEMRAKRAVRLAGGKDAQKATRDYAGDASGLGRVLRGWYVLSLDF